MADPHLLRSFFKSLPSGVQLETTFARTNRDSDTAVPSFIKDIQREHQQVRIKTPVNITVKVLVLVLYVMILLAFAC